MKIYPIVFLMLILLSSCFRNSVNKISKNDEIINKQIADSLNLVELNRIAAFKQKQSDSLRIADSLAALPAPINYDTVLFASILRTPCLGKCPHYEIRIYQSGLAEYIGYASVNKLGKYQSRLDSTHLKDISDMADKSGFFDLDDFYPNNGVPISDFPMCVCCVKKQDGVKIVYNRNDAPLNLIRFQNFLDKLFEEKEWESFDLGTERKAGGGILPERQ
jgi:hypothetical protein